VKQSWTNYRDIARTQSLSKILLVDDDVTDLEYYCSILQNQGHQVVVCSSNAAALRRLESEAFDFVVVSQGGPEFEGRLVAERAMEYDRHSPVLVLANSVDMGVYIEAMQLGAVDYLQKPVNPSEMTRVIRTHLRPQRLPRVAPEPTATR
jgi:two-component system, NtrC family, phosphoglycerate transport system response regulator PgtA